MGDEETDSREGTNESEWRLGWERSLAEPNSGSPGLLRANTTSLQPSSVVLDRETDGTVNGDGDGDGDRDFDVGC